MNKLKACDCGKKHDNKKSPCLCPLCGGEVKLWERKCDKAKYTIGCNNIECFLYIPPDVRLRELHTYGTCFCDKKELLKTWNTRVIHKYGK